MLTSDEGNMLSTNYFQKAEGGCNYHSQLENKQSLAINYEEKCLSPNSSFASTLIGSEEKANSLNSNLNPNDDLNKDSPNLTVIDAAWRVMTPVISKKSKISNLLELLDLDYHEDIQTKQQSKSIDFDYIDHRLNISENYQDYIEKSLQSMRKIKSVDISQEIKAKMITLPKQQKKHILILDLDETLVHSHFEEPDNTAISADLNTDSNKPKPSNLKTIVFFDKEINQEIKVNVYFRPGVFEFLNEASKHFQLGIFTASHKDYADAVISTLDPTGALFSFKLYREQCISFGKAKIKDLRILSDLDLSKTIILDNSIYSFTNQLSNGVLISSFYGSEEDQDLTNMLSYLVQYISQCNDVRYVNEQVFKFQFLYDSYL